MKTNRKYGITAMQVQNGSFYLLFLYPIKKGLMSVNVVLPIFFILFFKFTEVYCIGTFYYLFEKHWSKRTCYSTIFRYHPVLTCIFCTFPYTGLTNTHANQPRQFHINNRIQNSSEESHSPFST